MDNLIIRVFGLLLAFLIGCLYCCVIEFFVRPQYDINYEHKLLSHNGYNYCPYCGESITDLEGD